MSRSGLERLRDALDHCENAIRVAAHPDGAEFGSDRVRLQALLYDLIVIGTTFARVPPRITRLGPDIPWREIVRARNRFVHAYWDLDSTFIAGVVTHHLPQLADRLSVLIGLLEAQGE